MQTADATSLKTFGNSLRDTLRDIAQGVSPAALFVVVPLTVVGITAGAGFLLATAGLAGAAVSTPVLYGAFNLSVSAAAGAVTSAVMALTAETVKDSIKSGERVSTAFSKQLQRIGKFLGFAVPVAASALTFATHLPTETDLQVQPAAIVTQIASPAPVFNALAAKSILYAPAVQAIKAPQTRFSMP